jgi:PhnB protein
LRRSWTAAVDGAVYAQPLVVGSEVIVATENDSVYALDASSGAVRWSRHLAAPVTRGLPCGNIDPSGITGTPVADVATGRLWVVTFTDQPAYRHTLTELDLAAGRTVSQRPIDASGSDPRAQLERGALALLGSRVYVPFGGLYGDCSDYRGRVIWHRTGRDRAQPGGQLGWPAGHHPAGLVASGWGLLQPQGAGACRGPGGSRLLAQVLTHSHKFRNKIQEKIMASQLNPYLNFNGNARQALEFYASVFGGTPTISTFADFGAAAGPDASRTMHGALETPAGYTIMAADVTSDMEYHPMAGFSVSLSGDDEDLRGYWEQLSAGGTTTMPLQKQVWGDEFGMCVDKFGVSWLVNISQPQA